MKNTILDLRTYLDEAIKGHERLKRNQAVLASPTFSCRAGFPASLEEPTSQQQVGRLILQKEEDDKNRRVDALFNRIERLKTGIDIISDLQELGLRDGRSDTECAPDIEQMEALLKETLFFKETLEQEVMFEEKGARKISDFFHMAALRLANASMGIDRPETMAKSREGLEADLDNNRLVYGAFCVQALVLDLGQVDANHKICLQFERAVQRKIIPDKNEVRESLANYRVKSGHILLGVAKGLEVMERYMAGHDGAGMNTVPFQSAQMASLGLKKRPSLNA